MQQAEAAISDILADRAVLERCQAGDTQAFGIIVDKYMQGAYFTALGLVGNHDDALDLSQEAFVRAYRAISRFDVGKRFFTWYYKILQNLCLNHLRDLSRFVSLHPNGREDQGEVRWLEIPDEAADPSVLADRNDLTEKLWKAIATLKQEEREILILREFDGCSYAEIAERLEIPPGTVMSRLFNARKRLKQQLGAIR